VKLVRMLAGGLAVNRVAFGANYMARPAVRAELDRARGGEARNAGHRSLAGRAMSRSGSAHCGRSSAGCRVAEHHPHSGRDDRRAWMAGYAVADGADVATWLVRDRLPRRGAQLALGIAAASTAIALLGMAGTGRTAERVDLLRSPSETTPPPAAASR
jgi:hypothetical protein